MDIILRRALSQLHEKGYALLDVRPWIGGGDAEIDRLAGVAAGLVNDNLERACGPGFRPVVPGRPCFDLFDSGKREERWGPEASAKFSHKAGPRWKSLINQDGMGPATNVYGGELAERVEEALRPVVAAAYRVAPHHVLRVPERVGVSGRLEKKRVRSGAAGLHHDACFVPPDRRPAPGQRDPASEAQTFWPSGERLQCVVTLGGTGSEWTGFSGFHLDEVFDAYGTALGWPHSREKLPGGPFPLDRKALERALDSLPPETSSRVREEVVRIPPGFALLWWAGVAHANRGQPSEEDTVRIVKYVNYGKLVVGEEAFARAREGDRPALDAPLGLGNHAKPGAQRPRIVGLSGGGAAGRPEKRRRQGGGEGEGEGEK